MITRVEALRYRCLRYANVELRPFQILVGPNASGKSTFLDTVAFIADFLNEGLDAAVWGSRRMFPRSISEFSDLLFDGRGNSFELAVEMSIPERLRRENGHNQWTQARYQLSVGKSGDPATVQILEETFWLKPDGSPSEPRERLLFPNDPPAPDTILQGTSRGPTGWRKVVSKSNSGNDYFKSETTDWNNLFRLGPRKSALANLPEDEERFPVAIWAKRYLMEQVQNLALNSNAMRAPTPPGRPPIYDPNGANLPALVQHLKQQAPERFDEWVHHLQSALPDLKNVSVAEFPQNKSLYLLIDYGHVQVPSWGVSDGSLRVMALTLLAYLPGLEQTVMIEEPENGVHPQAVEAVFQSLSSLYDAQVFMATHSPLILGLAKPEQVLCFGKAPDGSCDIVRGDHHPKLRDWKGEVDLATLYAAGVLG